MSNYDFLNLSPPEFEELSRDLLQRHLSITLESFTTGKDKGIDLRYAGSFGNKIIVQCKRYSDFVQLNRILKKETVKVAALNPSRYIITISVGLTPHQKDEIQQLFPAYIKSTEDIYGRQDLNNLLGLYPDIEKQHFKLWLSGTNIMERILHSRIYNQSVFEEDKITETIKTYVENESYFEALEILKDKKYVIISGIPGIGKTTLARILVYHFLANGFEEFIFLSDSIKEAFNIYKEGVKQIFLFDDFLGRNFLDQKLTNNEEQRIVKFLEKVSSSKDKLIILTTREYILTQAKQRYDVFDSPALEFAKCVIDLSQYTKMVRAKILYNHLYFSTIGEEYINDIIRKQSYKRVIEHRNYSPRIIQTITNPDIWANIKPEEFSEKIDEFLDYPESIWKHVYENQVSGFSQTVLACLLSTGTPILYDDLKLAVQAFAKLHSQKYGISYSELEYRKSIRELENTFIITLKDESHQIAIEYQNPSVQDFLVNYFKGLHDFIHDILESAFFFNQLFNVFALNEKDDPIGKMTSERILLNDSNKQVLIKKIIADYDFLESSKIMSVRYRATMKTCWFRHSYSDYQKLTDIINEFSLSDHRDIKNFVSKTFGKLLIPAELDGGDYRHYMRLLSMFKDEYNFDRQAAIKKYFGAINALHQTEEFEKFKDLLPLEYERFMGNRDNYYERINEMAAEEAENADDDTLEDTLSEIQSSAARFGMSSEDAENIIDKRIGNKKEEPEDDYPWDKDAHRSMPGFASRDENTVIKDMFDSLKNE